MIPHPIVNAQPDDSAKQKIESSCSTRWRSERTVSRIWISEPRSRCAGGIVGRPPQAYTVSNAASRLANTPSTRIRSLRNRCERGTRSSTFISLNKDGWGLASLRIAQVPGTGTLTLLSQIRFGGSGVFQRPASPLFLLNLRIKALELDAGIVGRA